MESKSKNELQNQELTYIFKSPPLETPSYRPSLGLTLNQLCDSIVIDLLNHELGEDKMRERSEKGKAMLEVECRRRAVGRSHSITHPDGLDLLNNLDQAR